MDRLRNPYVPGAGLQPPELAGRAALLDDASADMDRVLAGRPAKGRMPIGLRGVGKTVLLNRLRGVAHEKGFQTVRVEAPEGSALPALLTPELRRLVEDGRLLVAAHTGCLGKMTACQGLEEGACGMPFEIVALDPDDLSQQVLIAHEGAPMGGVTVALQRNGVFYPDTFVGDRIGIVDLSD